MAYAGGVTTFTMGEEVLYDGERYVIWGVSEAGPHRYRLLASTPKGARVVWAPPEKLEPMRRYTTPNNDTARY